LPVQMAVWSKAWACSRSLAGFADSNPSRGVDICDFKHWVCIPKAEYLSRRVLPSVVCL